jgi:hypothetical protein
MSITAVTEKLLLAIIAVLLCLFLPQVFEAMNVAFELHRHKGRQLVAKSLALSFSRLEYFARTILNLSEQKCTYELLNGLFLSPLYKNVQ